MSNEPKVQTLGETENYVIWVSQEPVNDGDELDELYHIELGNVTLHLFPEEWEEFAALIMQAIR